MAEEPRPDEDAAQPSAIEQAGQIAESLTADPVYVDPAVEHLIPAPAVDSIAQKAADAPVPVYVVIIDADELAVPFYEFDTLLYAQLGREGVYLLTGPNDTLYADVRLEDPDISLEMSQRLRAADEEAGYGYEGIRRLDLALDALLSEEPLAENAAEAPAGPQRDTGSSQVQPPPAAAAPLDPNILMLAVLVGALFLAAGAAYLVRAVRGSSSAVAAKKVTYALPAELLANASRLRKQEMRASLGEDALQIAQRLAALETSTLSAEDARTVAHGLDAYDLARRIVEDDAATRADLAGALVLITTAGHDVTAVERSRAGRGADSMVRDIADLCTIDPTHGEASTHAQPETADASVPVCSACDTDMAAGRRPQWLVDDGRPYVEGSSVWARTLYGTSGGDLVALLHEEYGRRARGDA